jgi:hypothetical protein
MAFHREVRSEMMGQTFSRKRVSLPAAGRESGGTPPSREPRKSLINKDLRNWRPDSADYLR